MASDTERLTALRESAASRSGWGPRTIGRLTSRVTAAGLTEWIASVYRSDDDDERKAKHSLSGIGPTARAALDALQERMVRE